MYPNIRSLSKNKEYLDAVKSTTDKLHNFSDVLRQFCTKTTLISTLHGIPYIHAGPAPAGKTLSHKSYAGPGKYLQAIPTLADIVSSVDSHACRYNTLHGITMPADTISSSH